MFGFGQSASGMIHDAAPSIVIKDLITGAEPAS
jgi:hypothetical protein